MADLRSGQNAQEVVLLKADGAPAGVPGAPVYVVIENPPELASFVRVPDINAAGPLRAVGSTVVLLAGQGGLSAFTGLVEGFTAGTFVFERCLSADPLAQNARWDPIRTFRTGSYASGSTWTSPGAFYGNIAGATAVRVRVTAALNADAAVRLRASTGASTVSVGAIASNEGNIIGGTQSLLQLYSSVSGGRVAFNATSNVYTIASTAETAFAALLNPAGSGQDMFIAGINLGSSASVIMRRYRNATLTALPTPASPPVNRGGGTQQGAGRLYTQPSRTGGVLGKVTYVIGGGMDNDAADGSLVLRPGENMVWTVAGGGGGLGSTSTCAVEAVWWEQAAVA